MESKIETNWSSVESHSFPGVKPAHFKKMFAATEETPHTTPLSHQNMLFKNTETSDVYCMNPHNELIIHIKDTVIQYPYIVPVSSHIPTYVPSMIPNT